MDCTATWFTYANRNPVNEEEPIRVRSGGWETESGFRKGLSALDYSNASFEAAGAVLSSDGKVAYADTGDTHTMIIGSTGSLKSRTVCMPTLEAIARAGESVVVSDPKGELYDTVGRSFEEKGYVVRTVQFRDMMLGNRWNPFTEAYRQYAAGDTNQARNLVMDLSATLVPVLSKNDPFWDMNTQSMFYAISWKLLSEARSETDITIDAVYREMERIFMHGGSTSGYDIPECSAIKIIENLPDNTRHCIIASFNEHIWKYVCEDAVVDLMSASEIEMGAVGDVKTAIFLIVPDEKDTYNNIVSLFVKQLYTTLIARAHEEEDDRLKVRVNFLLDEFANFPKIPAMQNMITASRSRNIRFILVVQTVRQLRSVYGDDADAIKDNCLNWIFLTGRDPDFLKELSEIVGEDDDGKRLITVSGLQRLEVGTALVLCGRKNPIITRLADISRYGFSYAKPVQVPRTLRVDRKKAAPRRKRTDLSELFGD